MMGNATGCDERGQPHAAVSNEDDWKPALWAGRACQWFVNEGKQRQAYDQVDALGLIGQLLDIIQPGQHPPRPEPKKVDTGYRPAGELSEWPLDRMLF